LSTEALTHEILRGGGVSGRRVDPKSATPFANKSVTEETCGAYSRAVKEFFQSVGGKHLTEIVSNDILR
jgi:hypothetical protein